MQQLSEGKTPKGMVSRHHALSVISIFILILCLYACNPVAVDQPLSAAPVQSASASPAEPTPAPTQTPDIVLQPINAPASTPSFTATEFFTSGDVVADDMSYKSSDLNVKITNVNSNGVNYYVADCRMRGPAQLLSAFAKGQYGTGAKEYPLDIANQNNAIIAVNGDYYGARTQGIVIRNGKLYRDVPWFDTAAVFKDGSMKTFLTGQTTGKKLIAAGATQAYSFGPMLLDKKGNALTTFSQPFVKPANPRSGIGYIERNHFVLITVDGRGAGGSSGMDLDSFAKLFESLGCKSAYNLDGGGSAAMVFMGKVINHPSEETGQRAVSDIVYFGENSSN